MSFEDQKEQAKELAADKAIKSFTVTEANLSKSKEESLSHLNLSLIQLELKDITWKLDARKKYGKFFCWLLVLQNIAVYFLVIVAYFQGNLDKLQIILGILLTGTLGETVLIIKIMVNWMFKDIAYALHDNPKEH